MMIRLLRTSFFKRTLQYYRLPLKNCSKFLAMATIEAGLSKQQFKELVENIDVNLQQACELGKSAIVELMNVLEENTNEIAESYKDCLTKQINIYQESALYGHFSESWEDAILEYRSKANELSDELGLLISTFNTIRDMAFNNNMNYITSETHQIILIKAKFDELTNILDNHVVQIRILEGKVLNLQQKSIVNTK